MLSYIDGLFRLCQLYPPQLYLTIITNTGLLNSSIISPFSKTFIKTKEGTGD
ncbi:hypothetical protein [Gemelliphila asaccharolytica]|uniref:Uncharacterized protein n=1 Tax=Gemelliphila asaccharolytica TaxID=502393 RepID=A0ABR5TM14_9BACL|nr:hypothetical protein [Gemella asaccharolytica]KXB58112.1 hypothetical protein HMPREF1871_00622 [Gemella asaccharolytica]